MDKLVSMLEQSLKNIDCDKDVSDIQKILDEIEPEYRLGLHSYLSIEALERLYAIQDRIKLEKQIKEHIVWFYFQKKLNESFNDDILWKILNEYKKEQYIALESLIITILDSGYYVNQEVLCEIKRLFSDNAMEKALIKNKVNNIIKSKESITENEINKLLAYGMHKYLLSIIDSIDDVSRIKELVPSPVPGESNYKARMALYKKVHETQRRHQ